MVIRLDLFVVCCVESELLWMTVWILAFAFSIDFFPSSVRFVLRFMKRESNYASISLLYS